MIEVFESSRGPAILPEAFFRNGMVIQPHPEGFCVFSRKNEFRPSKNFFPTMDKACDYIDNNCGDKS